MGRSGRGGTCIAVSSKKGVTVAKAMALCSKRSGSVKIAAQTRMWKLELRALPCMFLFLCRAGQRERIFLYCQES
jgi:hypothetical protein